MTERYRERPREQIDQQIGPAAPKIDAKSTPVVFRASPGRYGDIRGAPGALRESPGGLSGRSSAAPEGQGALKRGQFRRSAAVRNASGTHCRPLCARRHTRETRKTIFRRFSRCYGTSRLPYRLSFYDTKRRFAISRRDARQTAQRTKMKRFEVPGRSRAHFWRPKPPRFSGFFAMRTRSRSETVNLRFVS